ncbi:BASS family bile acid:Na+ symporter [Saonia flava]|uniref:BASS family bile acid:Na+ symporter n=1 Tax=Saonia flava TaxID=523696 RepID=A0A846QZR4_9FLAO|nr:bile acid:sodium symporter family protein [Saonia flava]NJB72410.1 BASS family bile acid:Na+ symporter [Saonia flava]
MKSIYKYLLWAALVLSVLSAYFYFAGQYAIFGPLLVFFFLALAIGVRGYDNVKGFSFAFIIFAAVALAMNYPNVFVSWGDFQLKSLIVPLLQIIMFGMGTAMSIKDFGAVVKNPKAVFIGLACQFTIMPIIGAILVFLFKFPPEIAAGVILIGSSPSGLASNVMAYIGKANLALSVTLTTVATLLAPFVTPILMKMLGDQLVPIDLWGMMWSITKITILPIVAGLVFNKLFHGKTEWLDKAMPLVSMAGIALIITVITAAGRDNLLAMGALLVLVGLIHNLSGYFLGYWGCRLFKLDEKSCRTIAFEVGMQNAGLASGLATEMGKVATLGLAPAVFGPMMNITGSSLATWWRDKPIKEKDKDVEKKE